MSISLVNSYLDVTTSPVEIQMQVLNLSEVTKLVLYRLFVCFFVDICDDYDPAFDGADCCGFGVGLHFGNVVCWGGRGRVDFHVYVGHGFGCFNEVDGREIAVV